LRYLLDALSRMSGRFPKSFFLGKLVERDQRMAAGALMSDVYTSKYNGQLVAVKKPSYPREYRIDDDLRVQKNTWHNALVWRQLYHPNLVPFLGLDIESYPLDWCICSFVTVWMKNRNVVQYIKQSPLKPGITQTCRWMLDVAYGLQYLHSEVLVHGALHQSNVLIDDEGHARLSDYGLHLDPQTGLLGSINIHRDYWLSPELSLNARYPTPESDIFALAYLWVEVYQLSRVFSELLEHKRLVLVENGGRPPRPKSPSGIEMPDDVWSLVNQCWHQDPEQRPDATNLTILIPKLRSYRDE